MKKTSVPVYAQPYLNRENEVVVTERRGSFGGGDTIELEGNQIPDYLKTVEYLFSQVYKGKRKSPQHEIRIIEALKLVRSNINWAIGKLDTIDPENDFSEKIPELIALCERFRNFDDYVRINTGPINNEYKHEEIKKFFEDVEIADYQTTENAKEILRIPYDLIHLIRCCLVNIKDASTGIQRKKDLEVAQEKIKKMRYKNRTPLRKVLNHYEKLLSGEDPYKRNNQEYISKNIVWLREKLAKLKLYPIEFDKFLQEKTTSSPEEK